jgi:DNA-binding transcriptional MerR regulator
MHARTLPRHARTGQLALGWRKPRPGEDPDALYPIWPILGGDGRGEGGAGDDGGDDDTDDDQDDDADNSDTDDDGDEWQSVIKQWKAEGLKPAQIAERLKASRKWEQRAKKNSSAAEELARLKREGMSEVEAAVAAARAEERVKGGERIARSTFLAAAKGRIENPAEVVEEINLKKYVDDDGEVDDEAIAALVDKLAPKRSDKDDDQDDDADERDTRRRRRPARGYQGARNGSGRSKDKRGAVNGAELFEELLGREDVPQLMT